MKLNGSRIELCKLKPSAAQRVYEIINDKELVRWTIRIPYPYTKSDAVKYIRKTGYGFKKKKCYAFGVLLKETREIIGIVCLEKIWTGATRAQKLATGLAEVAGERG